MTELLMGGTAWFVYGFNALINVFLDWLFGAGAVVSIILEVGAYCMFAFWFGTKGVSVFSGRRAVEFWGKGFWSFIPIVNVFAWNRNKQGLLEPNIRGRVRKIIEMAREEDEEYNAKQQAKVYNRPNETP